MRSLTRSVLAGAFAAGVLVATAAGAWADCKRFVCVSGSDDGRTHIVYMTPVEGFRGETPTFVVSIMGLPQQDMPGNMFTMSERPGQVLQYSIDVCWKGSGLFASSNCSGWESFKHHVPTKF
ncbi:MAG TPA: hypothetical protein VG942_13480 [Hyphomonadaceae bacterium]|nr:hypothetical protein [Hyphomonadaceae bacterium]HVZ13008.1 hypothetical protein [Bauldia sp.]